MLSFSETEISRAQSPCLHSFIGKDGAICQECANREAEEPETDNEGRAGALQ